VIERYALPEMANLFADAARVATTPLLLTPPL
jgi:hypothetical protein